MFKERSPKTEGPFSHVSDKAFYEQNPKTTDAKALGRMENDYWEKRRSESYKSWVERLEPIRQYLIDIREGRIEPNEKVAIIALGGGMASIMSGGQLRGLEISGITPDIFKGKLDLYGISGGSGPIAYYGTGETSKANALFSEDCTTSDFLNLKRVHKMIDTTVIAKAMRQGPKRLDEQRIQAFAGNIFSVAQNKETGQNEFIDLKSATPDAVAGLEASSAIPPFRSSVEVNQKQYIDGGFEIVPLEQIIRNSEAKKVIVLPNIAFDHFGEANYNPVEGFIIKAASKFGSLGSLKTLEAHFTGLERFKNFLDLIEEQTQAEIAILWPPESGAGVLNNKKADVDNSILRSARETIDLFEGEQPDITAILPSAGNKIQEFKEAA